MKTVSIEYITKKLIKEYINGSISLQPLPFPPFTMIRYMMIDGDFRTILNKNDDFCLIDDGNKGFYITLNGKIINHERDTLNQIKI